MLLVVEVVVVWLVEKTSGGGGLWRGGKIVVVHVCVCVRGDGSVVHGDGRCDAAGSVCGNMRA